MTTEPSPTIVVQGDAVDVDASLDLLSRVYGRAFTRSWWRWKHVDCPWGGSEPFAVLDDRGDVASCFFRLPWRVEHAGSVLTTLRLVDGATNPSATRRGSFTTMVATALRTPRAELTFCTATPAAQRSHVRNGAMAIPPIRYVVRPVRWAEAAVESSADLVDTFECDRDGTGTSWDDGSLRWRIDPRSGSDYTVSRLVHGSGSHGVVHRANRGGPVPTLSVLAQWGSRDECRRVVRAVARSERAMLVHSPSGPGTSFPETRGVRRGESLLCVWDHRAGDRTAMLADRSSWALDGLTLEGVI